MATVYLVDALPYVFRAYFSLPTSMKCPAGNPIGAVKGYADTLWRLLEHDRPTHLAVAFDESLNSSFRNEFYAPYKAQRELPPADLERQLHNCQRVSRALGCATFVDKRYEADDIIATLARRMLDAGHNVVVVTADKDMCQLVTDRVSIYDLGKDVRLGPAEVVTKMGVRAEQVPDFLGLAGDAVDNIPGIKGVGPKTATALLAHFPNLEAMYERLSEVASLPIRGAKALAPKLEAGKEMAFLSRRLATVAYDAPVKATFADLEHRGPNRPEAESLFEELGFETLRRKVHGSPAAKS